MNIGVLCEFSGIVAKAFRDKGHYVVSCDLQPSELPGNHIQGDCRDYDWSWCNMVLAFPPCDYLSKVQNGLIVNNKERQYKRYLAFDFFLWCYYLSVKKVVVENPVGYINSHFRQPDQIIQPYYFGDPEQKGTCLWIRGLPYLVFYKEENSLFDNDYVGKPKPKAYYKTGKQIGKPQYFVDSMSGTREVKKRNRSRTFLGIAKVFADNWG